MNSGCYSICDKIAVTRTFARITAVPVPGVEGDFAQAVSMSSSFSSNVGNEPQSFARTEFATAKTSPMYPEGCAMCDRLAVSNAAEVEKVVSRTGRGDILPECGEEYLRGGCVHHITRRGYV